ncbi:MAG: polysaccharide biosynthesis protein [Bacteroidales bacterium]
MKLFNTKSYTPRWIIFTLDLLICTVSVFLAYFIRFNLEINGEILREIRNVLPLILGIRAFSFYIFRSYAGTIRFTSIKDTERVFLVVFIGSAILASGNVISYFFFNGSYILPFSVIIIDYLLTGFMMVLFRLFIKSLYFEVIHPSKRRSNAIILGANEFGRTTKTVFENNGGSKNKVVAFVDFNKNHAGMKLDGVTVYPTEKIDYLLKKYNVSDFIIPKNENHWEIKNKVVEKCLEKGVQILKVPEESQWINGQLSYNQIRNIQIEELLGRETIKLDKSSIIKDLHKKTILVTGAAGSIGSEIVRQLTAFYPEKIILYDQAESPLYELELELMEKFGFHNFYTEIGSINSFFRLDQVFRLHKPSIIYHAAAYKHVPMMEHHPSEAVTTNVWGTKNLADLAITHAVEKFVMVSTDKAVNPTNVMGATKRIAEMYIQSMNQKNITSFITTRFGNVLGSNGSVIPRFEKQIEKGGPITITHPDITRYFMSIPEACQLVLEAGTMGKGGEIFIFNMGRSLKILDLAKKMIKLHGLTLNKDIEIKITGLRPGEKLYEELLSERENVLPTYHPKIRIAKVQEYEPEEIENKVKSLLDLVVVTHSKKKIVREIKSIVPEYVIGTYYSKNMRPINGSGKKASEISQIQINFSE